MSTQPRKERKRQFNLPHHQRKRRLTAHLAEDLLMKYDRRSFPVREGDTVKILRGDFRGDSGKVLSVDTVKGKITVEGATLKKSDQSEVAKPIDASNVIITKLDLSDPRRQARIEGSSSEEASS